MQTDWDRQLINKRILIELTDHCNLNCFMCCNRKAPHGIKQGFMDFKLYKKILDEVNLDKAWSLELFWLGESLLHPLFDEILEFTLQKIKNTSSHVNLHTNATLLNPQRQQLILKFGEKFPWITFSIDAITQPTYAKIRHGKLQQVLANIESFILLRKKLGKIYPHINLQFIIMNENADEAKKFAEHWKTFYKKHELTSQDNIFFKRLEVHNIEKQQQANKLYDDTIKRFGLFTMQNEIINIISKDKEKPKPAYWFEEKTKKRRVCAAPFKNPVIRWDGELTVCCFDDIFLYSMGNLKHKSFKEIWYGLEMDEFRMKHIQGRYDELLTSEGWSKCRDCIGYYWPTISDEEINIFLKSRKN